MQTRSQFVSGFYLEVAEAKRIVDFAREYSTKSWMQIFFRRIWKGNAALPSSQPHEEIKIFVESVRYFSYRVHTMYHPSTHKEVLHENL